jgi:peptidoglycan/LPS O-acetylase OafA/YrhL
LRFTALFLLLAAVVALLEDRRAATFILLGALVWELSNAFHWLRLMALEACLTLWACFVPIGWLELTAFHLCLAVMLFASPQRVWLLSWLGDRSYSFYLCHGLGIGMVRLVLDHGAPTWRSSSLWIFAYVITALIGAFFWTILVYELIEKRRKRVTRTEPESQPASKPATGAATERIPLPVGGAVPALKATGA